MSDDEIKKEFMNALVIQGLSMRKAALRLNVSYATLHRCLQPEITLSRMMRHRMQGFINNII